MRTTKTTSLCRGETCKQYNRWGYSQFRTSNRTRCGYAHTFAHLTTIRPNRCLGHQTLGTHEDSPIYAKTQTVGTHAHVAPTQLKRCKKRASLRTSKGLLALAPHTTTMWVRTRIRDQRLKNAGGLTSLKSHIAE